MTRRVAAITGGAGHIARNLADRGLLIAVLDKSVAAGQALISELQARHPAGHQFIEADLMQLEAGFGRLDYHMVSPGGIERNQSPRFRARYNQRTPLGRMGTENDIAGMVSLLLSPDGAYITGQHMLIDGGWTAW